MTILEKIKEVLEENSNAIPFNFVIEQAKLAKITHSTVTKRLKICVITTVEDVEVFGTAMIIDAENEDEEAGKKAALTNAMGELWKYYSTLAKIVI